MTRYSLRFRRWIWFSAVAVFVGWASPAYAQLILNVDTDNQTVWFSGSNAGLFTVPYQQWGSGSEESLDISNTVSITGDVSDTGGPTLYLDSGSSISVFINFDINDLPGNSTITGSGEGMAVSYAGFSANNITYLESASLTTITRSQADGYGSAITVNHISAVPEPSSYAACFGVIVLAGAFLRRRRNTS